jgi:hypothetical protein
MKPIYQSARARPPRRIGGRDARLRVVENQSVLWDWYRRYLSGSRLFLAWEPTRPGTHERILARAARRRQGPKRTTMERQGPLTGGSGGLQRRPIHRNDIREWMDLLASHPVLGPQYVGVIEQLPAVWMHLRESAASISTVFVLEEDPRTPLCCGVSVVTRDSFVCDMKRSPCWIGPAGSKDRRRRITSGRRRNCARRIRTTG